MATEKKTAEVKEEKKTEKPAAVKEEKKVEKKVEKKEKKATVKVDTSNKDIAKATKYDFSVIISPLITEKTMANIQNLNKATFKVKESANKVEIKEAFERIFKVKATNVTVSSVRAKSTTRGGRYQGKFAHYKKATITIAEGQAIDLFKE